jgi:hypothetical protein
MKKIVTMTVALFGLIGLSSIASNEIQFGADFLDEMMSASQAKKIACPSNFLQSIRLNYTCYRFPTASREAIEVYKKNWDDSVEQAAKKLKYRYKKTTDWKDYTSTSSMIFELEEITFNYFIDSESYFGDLIAVFGTAPLDPFVLGSFFMLQDGKEITQTQNFFFVEQSGLKYTFAPTSKLIRFKVQNTTKLSVKIIWDESTIISFTKEALGVFHSGVKYVDLEKSQIPTVTPQTLS